MRQLLESFITRVRGWYAWRRPASAALPLLIPSTGPIFREVSSMGVKVFSLCGSCGARLEMSATLCEACARRRSPSSPF